jgi:hypothetical protein
MPDNLIFSDGDYEVLQRRGILGRRLFLRYDTGDLIGTVRTDQISEDDAERVIAGSGHDVVMELKRRLGW